MKDILLHFDSYPDPTPSEAIDQAVQFASALNAELTTLAVQVAFKAPGNWLAERLININGICAAEEARSLANCTAAIETVSARLAAANVRGRALLTRAEAALMGDHVSVHARTRDLCLVPVTDRLDGQRSVAEAVLFGSGRPVLLYRPGVADLPKSALGTVVLAWDGSRCAARAMADALPVLQKAREVRIVTVIREKPEATAGLGADAMRHLAVHGIGAVADEVDIMDRKIGQVLCEYVASKNADLLVMGGYGRSKMREFILGGATQHMLNDSNVPMMLSH